MADQRASQSGPATEIRRAKERRPARQTEVAESHRRESWSGFGERNVTEKDGVGVFLDDVTYVFADISILSIPVLGVVMSTPPRHWFGVKGAALVAWLTMVATGALVRGGWVKPLASDVRGWVSMTPWLILFRLGYYNAVLALASFGGRAAEGAVSPVASLAFALVVGSLGIGLFPRLAESFYGVVAG